MTERVLTGLAASPGVAAGAAHVLDASPVGGDAARVAPAQRDAEAARALDALRAAGEEITNLASSLAAAGNSAEAEIVETGALVAADPGLADAVRRHVLEDGDGAASAILRAATSYADTLGALDDPVLRLRSDDVRSLGRRAARVASGNRNGSSAAGDSVLVASDLGPADVAEIGDGVRAIALADGGVMAHAAIVARSLGIPMAVGLGPDILTVEEGTPLVVDGGDGSVTIAPGREQRRRAHVAAARRLRDRERSLAARGLPAETVDGHRIRVLTNVASSAEVGVGLAAGADGVGLLRTELRFLEAHAWPTEDQHRAALSPTLAALTGVVATVRMLDFGGDKTPPFLTSTAARGIGLLIANPQALADQAAAIAAVGAHTELRVLLPMVERPEDVQIVRAVFAAVTPGGQAPPIGAMIETVAAAARADEIAAVADFLSIGTNDLTHSVLGSDRFAPGESFTHHPLVLAEIARVASAASARGRVLEVCGEAASDAVAMPLLLGLGVDELSVGAARVGTVRAWVRALGYEATKRLAHNALGAESAYAVAEQLRPTSALLAQIDDQAGESVDGGLGVVAVGGES